MQFIKHLLDILVSVVQFTLRARQNTARLVNYTAILRTKPANKIGIYSLQTFFNTMPVCRMSSYEVMNFPFETEPHIA